MNYIVGLTLWELKSDAHLLIDELVELGMTQQSVYGILGKEFGVREFHIGDVLTVERMHKVIALLEKERDFKLAKRASRYKKQKKAPPPKKEPTPEQLARKAEKAAARAAWRLDRQNVLTGEQVREALERHRQQQAQVCAPDSNLLETSKGSPIPNPFQFLATKLPKWLKKRA